MKCTKKADFHGRRQFLRLILVFGGLSASCGKEKNTDSDQEKASSPEKPLSSDPCADLGNLSTDMLKVRESFSYVAKSPYKDQLCDNCQFWIAPKEGHPCGGCVTIQGPIHPKGYCSYWAPQL